MPTAALRGVLFVSAYAPLLFLFALLDSFGRGWASIACAALGGLSVLLLLLAWRVLSGQARTRLELAESRPRDNDVIGFFATYVVPFAAAQDSNRNARLALLLFLIIVGGLYLRADLFYVNPLLALAGIRVFEGATTTGRPVLLLTRRRFLPQQDTVYAAQISGYVYLERPQ